MSFLSRQFQFGKFIIVLVFMVVGLQVFHMTLLMKLETNAKGAGPRSSNHLRRQGSTDSDFKEIQRLAKAVMDKIADVHISDISGMYHIIRNILCPKQIRKFGQGKTSENVTIVTQTSSNHLENLIVLSRKWNGPISVSVFTHKTDAEFAILSIVYLRTCYPSIANKVSFHLVYPMDSTPSVDLINELPKLSCSEPFGKTVQRQQKANYDIGIEYPHNLLRNIALKSATTTFVLMIDIDMVPSDNLTDEFMRLIERRRSNQDFDIDKTAFVVPSFESKDWSIPSDKIKLLHAWEAGKIRPFYYETCWKCQRYTEYDRWKKLFGTEIMDIGYNVEWNDPWEPFYIASANTPLYDERFKQYGFNRISQVCELHVAGYEFAVLNNAFLVHKGFKVPEKFHKTKDMEQEKNRMLFRKFKNQLKTRYPNSPRRC